MVNTYLDKTKTFPTVSKGDNSESVDDVDEGGLIGAGLWWMFNACIQCPNDDNDLGIDATYGSQSRAKSGAATHRIRIDTMTPIYLNEINENVNATELQRLTLTIAMVPTPR